MNEESCADAAAPRREWGMPEDLLLIGYAEAVAS